jgi:hypothetical protein
MRLLGLDHFTLHLCDHYMKTQISVLFLLLFCYHTNAQNAGWQWVDNAQVKIWGSHYISFTQDEFCNVYAVHNTLGAGNDTLITKFSQEGQRLAFLEIKGGKYNVGGIVKSNNGDLIFIIYMETRDSFIIGKDTIRNNKGYSTSGILYIELDHSDLSVKKMNWLVSGVQSPQLRVTHFEIINSSIFLSLSFYNDTITLNDGTKIPGYPSNYKVVILQYDPKTNKIIWTKEYAKAMVNRVNTICHQQSNLVFLGSNNDSLKVTHIEILAGNGDLKALKRLKTYHASITKVIANSNHIYVSGGLGSDTAIIGDTMLINSLYSFFLAEFDTNLNMKWIRFGRGTCIDMCIDIKGIISFIGEYYNAGNYESYEFKNPYTKTAGVDAKDQMFILRLDSLGNLLFLTHPDVPFHNHPRTILASVNDIFIAGVFHYHKKHQLNIGTSKLFAWTAMSVNIIMWHDIPSQNYISHFHLAHAKILYLSFMTQCLINLVGT